MNNTEIKNAVAEAAKAAGAEGYELTIEAGVSAGAEALKDEISSVTYTRTGSMRVRCVKDGKSGYAESELVTPEAAAELVYRACANAAVVDDPDEVPLFEGSESYTVIEEEKVEIPSAEELIAHTLEVQKKLYAQSDKVVDGTQSFTSGMSEEKAFISSAGLDLSYETSLVYHGAVAAVKDGEDAQEDYEVADVSKKSIDEIAQQAVKGALDMLGADSVDSGKYDIIIDKATMRSVLAVFSSVFSARSAFLKTTLLAGKEGEVIASDILTIADDPFHPDKFGKCPFDAEGVAVYKKNIVEKGVLKTLLYNRMYAKLFAKETTGNAASAKNIAPRGMYIEGGTMNEDQLIRLLGDGIYITELKGLHAGANVQSGDFSLEAAGFLVENGRKTRPVKNFTIADNFYSMIKKVAAISDKVEFGAGSSFGSPEVMFTDVSVAGK